ncbi:hypothetical protein M7I_8198 [Glarea lozoyensis 74030]|uniref:Uncharacterized protein n=1 Tax=Glarea lozoyensis (strain ATCC 74030 / MF5533) TaxID=1104152 RepID=H0EZD4_GLAL7|nr:hypothetical protein M7I_8198 [Glarea lozoyensis 74030]
MLSNELAVEQVKLKQATKDVAWEYADHVKYRDSHMKKLRYKLGGKKDKFEEEASKEEKEWLEAKELDELYNSLFDGPTPEVPGEDELEEQTKDAEKAFHDAQLRLNTEQQARSTLQDADKSLALAIKELDNAMKATTADAWALAGEFAAMQKYNLLNRAQTHISHVEFLMNQARAIQPAIKSIGKIGVQEMQFVNRIVFEEFSSNSVPRARIGECLRVCGEARGNLEGEVGAEERRVTALEFKCNEALGRYEGRKRELQRVRGEAFERVVGKRGVEEGDGDGDAPPGYEEAGGLPDESI